MTTLGPGRPTDPTEAALLALFILSMILIMLAR